MPSLPRVVFEHFRKPQRKGQLEDPSARGEVSGRGPNSKIILEIAVADERISDAAFQTGRDRSCDAPLSLLGAYIVGRSLAEVEALDVQILGAHYGLVHEQLPLLLVAIEALTAAIADLRGQPSPYAFEGGVVCTCLNVREGRIRRAVRERKLETVRDVSFWTRACTGCRTCRTDIERIIKDERSKQA